MQQPLDRGQGQQQAQLFLYAGWFDVALGIVALLWGDALMPSARPIAFGLGIGTIAGLVLLLVAAPISFSLYYFRLRLEAGKAPASRSPVEKL